MSQNIKSLEGYQLSPKHQAIADYKPADHGITKPELEAIADNVLTAQERQLWNYLHNPTMTDGKYSLTSLCIKAGFEKVGNQAGKIIDAMFGKMETAGVSRACSFDVMCGFTAENVKLGLAELFKSDDEKVRVKSLDIASKIQGLQKTGTNVNVNQSQGIQVNARVIKMIDDDESIPSDS